MLRINNIWMHNIGVRKEGKHFKLTISWGDDTYGGAFSSFSNGIIIRHMMWKLFLMSMWWLCVGFVYVFLARRRGSRWDFAYRV